LLKIEIIVLLTDPPVAAPTVDKAVQPEAKLLKLEHNDQLKEGKAVNDTQPLNIELALPLTDVSNAGTLFNE